MDIYPHASNAFAIYSSNAVDSGMDLFVCFYVAYNDLVSSWRNDSKLTNVLVLVWRHRHSYGAKLFRLLMLI